MSSCSVKLSTPLTQVTNTAPQLDTFSVTNSAYTNSTTYGLIFSITGMYSEYCLLENDTTQSNCVWTVGTIPSNYTVTATENAKILSLWVKNEHGTSSRMDSNSVTLDTTAPIRPTALALSSPASSPDTDTTPTLSLSSIEAQASVQLFSNNTCTTQVGSLANAGAGGTVTATANTLAATTYNFYATQTDRAGNISPCSVSTVSYQLNAGTAVLTIAANTFTDTIVGNTSTATFTATNSGTGPATLAAGTPKTLTTGTNYAIIGGTCTASAVLAVSGTCTIFVQFIPNPSGTFVDTINLAYNDGSTNQSATRAITANGLAPALLAFTKTEQYFGKVLLGGAGNPVLLTLENQGDVTATLTNPNLDKITPSNDLQTESFEFGYVGGNFPGTSGTCSSTLASGSSCDIYIYPRPSLEGQQSLLYGFQYDDGLNTGIEVNIPISYFGMPLIVARPNPTVPWTFDAGTFQASDLLSYSNVPIILYNPSDYRENFSVSQPSCASSWGYTGGAYPGSGAFTSDIPLCGASLHPKTRCRLEFAYRASSAPAGVLTAKSVRTPAAL